MQKGSFPQWWEEWEEPQPSEAPPEPPRNIAELIAEAAADLPLPKATLLPLVVQPSVPEPVVLRRSSRVRVVPSLQTRAVLHRIAMAETVERLARKQRRQTALLLLMRLLD